MEGILAFIVIIFSVIAAANGNKKNKKTSARTRPSTPAQQTPAQRMAAQRMAAQRMPKTAPAPRANPAPVDPILPPMDMDEGDSLADGVCVGGSMEHTAHQGESSDDGMCVGGSIAHTTHQGESADDGMCLGGSLAHDTHEGAETPMTVMTAETADTEVSEGARFTAQDMRSAFIASEIFARPKALRRS